MTARRRHPLRTPARRKPQRRNQGPRQREPAPARPKSAMSASPAPNLSAATPSASAFRRRPRHRPLYLALPRRARGPEDGPHVRLSRPPERTRPLPRLDPAPRRAAPAQQRHTSQNPASPPETRTFLGDGEPALSRQFKALRQKSAGTQRSRKIFYPAPSPGGRIIAPMTRARTASYGVVTPPPLDRWIEAVLMLCVSLVQGAATTLGMIFNRSHRDWHTETAHEALPQATSGISSQGTQLHPRSHSRASEARPENLCGPSRGLASDPLETNNRHSRHKAENDPARVTRRHTSSPPPSGRGAVCTGCVYRGSLQSKLST